MDNSLHHYGSYLRCIPSILLERSAGLTEDEDWIMPFDGPGIDVSYQTVQIDYSDQPAPPYAVLSEQVSQPPSSHPT